MGTFTDAATPSTSLFNTYGGALHVQAGELLKAIGIAKEVGFTQRDFNPRRRLENHVEEYLFVGRIRSERILAVVPAMGAMYSITVHLGVLGMPQSFLAGVVPAAGEALEEALEREIKTDLYIREGIVNEVKVHQILRAFCLAALD